MRPSQMASEKMFRGAPEPKGKNPFTGIGGGKKPMDSMPTKSVSMEKFRGELESLEPSALADIVIEIAGESLQPDELKAMIDDAKMGGIGEEPMDKEEPMPEGLGV